MKISNLLAFLALLCPSIVDAGPLSNNWGLDVVEAPKAWKLAQGGSTVKVCVIDTGIDVTHPELSGRICDPINGDEYGWDFVNNRKNPVDAHGHGTHVAGILRAVSPSACIIPVKWFEDKVKTNRLIAATIESIKYCKARGAKIVNFSGGGSPSNGERLLIKSNKSMLFVVAAGNEYTDLDRNPAYFPAGYDLDNLISVASTDANSSILNSSDYGPGKVQLAAPGENIFSLLPGDKYAYLTGTSMATPFVSGIAAMIWSKYPKLTIAQVRRILMESVDKIENLKDKVKSGGRVNAFKAMKLAKKIALQSKIALVE